MTRAGAVNFAMRLVREFGVATVPGSSFYHSPGMGKDFIRFTFSKKDETLHDAGRRHGRHNVGPGSQLRKEGSVAIGF